MMRTGKGWAASPRMSMRPLGCIHVSRSSVAVIGTHRIVVDRSTSFRSLLWAETHDSR